MPGRGHKIASRQAQLGQRRRRQNRPVTAGAPQAPPPTPMGEVSNGNASLPAVATAPDIAPARPVTRARAQYHPVVLDHIGQELRRIATLGIITLAVLVVLTIVLI